MTREEINLIAEQYDGPALAELLDLTTEEILESFDYLARSHLTIQYILGRPPETTEE